MKIAVDLDGVTFEFLRSYLTFIKQVTGVDIPQEKVTGWHFLLDNGFTEEEDHELMHKFCLQGGYLHLPMIPEARYYLYMLHHDFNHEIVFLTSRPPIAMMDTFVAIEREGFNFELHMSDKQENTKGHIAKALGCDMLIDDKWEFLQEAKDENPELITMLFNYEKQLHPPTEWQPDYYVESWPQVLHTIQRMQNIFTM